jgi:hypothetical protein
LKKAKFLIFLGLLVLQRAIVFAAPIPISTNDSIIFQFNTAGGYSANQIADMIMNGATYSYSGPETAGAPRSFTAINNASQETELNGYYLVGNSSVAQGATDASFVVVGTGSILSGNANVNVASIASGASLSIDTSAVNALRVHGGTLDQRGISSPLTISGAFTLSNASLILPLSQSGQVQSYLSCDGGGQFGNQSFSVILYNPLNATLLGQSYPIIQGSVLGGNTSSLTAISVMDASGQIIPITSYVPTFNPDSDNTGNGNCTVQFSVNPTIYNGHYHKQAGRASTYSHQYIQKIAGSATSVARGERGPSPAGYAGSFTSNPFKAPNMTEFMPMTEGAQEYSARENLDRWSPLRTDKTGIWVQPFGMVLREVAQQEQPGFNSKTAGLLFGMDHKLRYDLIVGGAIGYATTKQSLDQNSGKTSVRDRFIDIFATWFRDAWYIDGALLLGYEQYNQSRNVGNNVFALNHHAGFLLTPRLGGGYTFSTKVGKLSVFANFGYTYCKQFGYQETGANANDLYVKSSLATMIRSEVGTSVAPEYSWLHLNWKPKFALSLVNKKPIRKGTIATANGSSFEGSKASSTNISPALYSILSYEDGWSLSAGLIGEFGVRYNMGEAFFKFTKKLGTR